MRTSEKGIELIKAHESLKLNAYQCPAGVWTIGYGHTRGVSKGMSITRMDADRMLKEDLRDSEDIINRQNLDVNQNQFDALVSFVFNVGAGNFESSTLLSKAKINVKDRSIPEEFRRWVYAKGRILPGLVKRRTEESELWQKA